MDRRTTSFIRLVVTTALVCAGGVPVAALAQHNPASAESQDSLRAVVAELDARYFDAYNRCDLDALHAADLEAYHDLGGGPVSWETMREMLARGLCAVPGHFRRELVPGTLEVYPIAGVGALQLADHLFYEQGEDGEEHPTTAAKMIVLWRHTEGGWAVSRLISYDHGPPPTSLDERMVDVDGYALRVQTAGLNTRRPGEPVVVFENGALAPVEAWGGVPAEVASFAPVVTYDRSTVGRSEWDGEVGTPAHVTAKLRALLRTLDVDPPYVLVGWSWGGDLVRYHAGSHPEDVAGLVHVDPAGHSPAAALAVLQALGFDEAEYAAEVAAMDGALPTLPPAGQADVKAINQIYADQAEPEYGPVPSVPTAVLLSGTFRPPSPEEVEAFGEVPYDRRAHFEARLRSKVDRLSEWALAVPEGFFAVARNSGHAIQQDEPELVVDAIRRVVFPDPARQLRAVLDRDGVDALPAAYEALHRRYAPERLDEYVLNRLGYDLLGEGRTEAAIAVFELNVRTYPEAWNPHDSLGDAYAAAGETEKAAASYRRSLALNPDGPSAQKLDALEDE